jgi:hypothetical protein
MPPPVPKSAIETTPATTPQVYVALYNHDAQVAEQVSFRKGDRMQICGESQIESWLMVRLEKNGQQGYAASTYIKLLPNESTDSSQPSNSSSITPRPPPARSNANQQNNQAEQVQLIAMFNFEPTDISQVALKRDDVLILCDPSCVSQFSSPDGVWLEVEHVKDGRRGLAPSTHLRTKVSTDDDIASPSLWRAMYRFDATDPQQLSLAKGDCVRVIEEDASGWYYVVNPITQQEGLSPAPFLKRLTPEECQIYMKQQQSSTSANVAPPQPPQASQSAIARPPQPPQPFAQPSTVVARPPPVPINAVSQPSAAPASSSKPPPVPLSAVVSHPQIQPQPPAAKPPQPQQPPKPPQQPPQQPRAPPQPPVRLSTDTKSAQPLPLDTSITHPTINPTANANTLSHDQHSVASPIIDSTILNEYYLAAYNFDAQVVEQVSHQQHLLHQASHLQFH